MIREFKFDNFTLFCLTAEEDLYEVSHREDLMVRSSRLDFLKAVLDAGNDKLNYLTYWGQYANKRLMDAFQELTVKHDEIKFIMDSQAPDCSQFFIRAGVEQGKN